MWIPSLSSLGADRLHSPVKYEKELISQAGQSDPCGSHQISGKPWTVQCCVFDGGYRVGRLILGKRSMPLKTSCEKEVRLSQPSRSVLSWFLLVGSLTLITWLFYERQDELAVLWRIRPTTVAALFGLQGVFLVVQAGRYRAVLEKCSGRHIEFLSWFHLFIVGRFLNLFMPQAGNLYRGFELRRRFDVTVTSYLTALFAAAWVAAVVNFAIGTNVVLVARPNLQLGGISVGLVLGVAAVLTAAVPVAGARALARLDASVTRFGWLRARFMALLQVAVGSIQDPRYLVRIIGWSVTVFAQAVFIYRVCFSAVGVDIGMAEIAAFYAILQVTTFVMITPGNLGVQELAFGALGAGIGAGAVEGVIVSALLRITGIAAVVALATPLGGLRLLKATRKSRG
jgi:uncharacterized membrane protein YbhN (UPF0104 family)